MADARGSLFSRPEYFAERRNADGSLRFYWKAPARLAKLLEGTPFPPVVRLDDDPAKAQEECRNVTARVNAFLRTATGAAPAAQPGAAHTRATLRIVDGTLAHAIAEYKQSKAYRDVAARTKKQYDWMLGMVEGWGGHLRIKEIGYRMVMEAAEKLADKPRSRQLFLTLLAMVIDRTAHRKASPGEVISNPVRLVLEEIEKPEPAGGWIWPNEAVLRFARAAEILGRPSIATAILLNEWLAQRTGDLLALPRTAYREGVLHFVQSKTGQYVPITATAYLRSRIEWQFAEDRAAWGRLRGEAPGKVVALREGGDFSPRTLIVCDTTGEPWKLDHFRHEFARIRSAVGGLEDAEPADIAALAAEDLHPVGGFILDATPRRLWEAMREGARAAAVVRTEEFKFSHLRHTGITRLRQAGCSDEEIRAISGHSNPATVYKHYLAVTAELAADAFARREEYERGLATLAHERPSPRSRGA